MGRVSSQRLDPLSPAERSERMSRVRCKDTKPEIFVRRLVHAQGYRYRLHSRKLPGNPDLVFPGRNKVIFVHGCFWHRHPKCPNSRFPKTRRDFWVPKLEGNRRRDLATHKKLRSMGYSVLVVWECEIKKQDALLKRMIRFLEKTQ